VPIERQRSGRDHPVHDAAVPHGVLELLVADVHVPVHLIRIIVRRNDDAAPPPRAPRAPAPRGREPRLGEAEGRQEVEQRGGDAPAQPRHGSVAAAAAVVAAAGGGADEGEVLRVAGAVAAVEREEEVEGEGVEEGGDGEGEEEELLPPVSWIAVGREGGRTLTKERNSDMVLVYLDVEA
jgi:hypothetical protein